MTGYNDLLREPVRRQEETSNEARNNCFTLEVGNFKYCKFHNYQIL